MSLAGEDGSFFTVPHDFPDYIFSLGLTPVSLSLSLSLGICFVHFQADQAGASPGPRASRGSLLPPRRCSRTTASVHAGCACVHACVRGAPAEAGGCGERRGGSAGERPHELVALRRDVPCVVCECLHCRGKRESGTRGGASQAGWGGTFVPKRLICRHPCVPGAGWVPRPERRGGKMRKREGARGEEEDEEDARGRGAGSGRTMD